MVSDKDRFCKCCKQTKDVEEFKYPRSNQCKDCYRNKNRLKHKRYRHENPIYVAKKRKYTNWYRSQTPRGRAMRNKYMRYYSKTPRGREIALRALLKFMGRHPYYNQDYLEMLYNRIIGGYELDRILFDDGRRITRVIDILPDKKVLTPLEILIQKEENEGLGIA